MIKVFLTQLKTDGSVRVWSLGEKNYRGEWSWRLLFLIFFQEE